MNDLQMYEEAKERFRKAYIISYPMPTRAAIPDLPTMQAFWRSPMVWVTIFIAIAAAFMSALRTFHVLDTVDSKAGAIAGIIVIEGMAGLISFFLVLRKYKESGETESGIRGFMLILTYGAISLGLLTNIYSIMLSQHKIFSNVEWAVVIMAGSIAVFAIAILMHILGTEYVSILADFDKATLAYEKAINYTEDRYREDLQAWANEFEAQWKKPTNQRKYIGLVNTSYQQSIEARSSYSVPTATPAASAGFARLDYQNRNAGTERNGTIKGTELDLARQVLAQYPNLELSDSGWHSRIEETTGVKRGRATTRIYQAMQYISNQSDTLTRKD